MSKNRGMKGAVRSVASRLGRIKERISGAATPPYFRKLREDSSVSVQVSQVMLAQLYRDAAARKGPLPTFRDAEFRCFSQFGEDGILLFLFSVLGTTNRRVIEICASDGIECNAANLIVNHGWEGLLFDGDAQALERGRAFYRDCPATNLLPPALVSAWITAENVNALIEENGFAGEVDLFSLDMDGVDYWIWKAITAFSPRVIVLEYNNLWGPDDSVTAPYVADFSWASASEAPRGASLAAFVKLGREKGYRLVGCHRYGFNAFLVRNDLGAEVFPEVSVASCMENAFTRYIQSNRGEATHDGWMTV